MKEGCIPEDWKSSVVLPIYTGKGDQMECGFYGRIKLLEHAMKVVKSIFEYRIWQHICIQIQENFPVKGKKLCFGFVDLESFGRVLREVIRWAMHKLGVEEWFVSAVFICRGV